MAKGEKLSDEGSYGEQLHLMLHLHMYMHTLHLHMVMVVRCVVKSCEGMDSAGVS